MSKHLPKVTIEFTSSGFCIKMSLFSQGCCKKATFLNLVLRNACFGSNPKSLNPQTLSIHVTLISTEHEEKLNIIFSGSFLLSTLLNPF